MIWERWYNFVSPSTENSMNCNENNQIAFSDVGVLTHASKISFSLSHARAHQQSVVETALKTAGRELSECKRGGVHGVLLPLGFTLHELNSLLIMKQRDLRGCWMILIMQCSLLSSPRANFMDACYNYSHATVMGWGKRWQWKSSID